MANAAGGGGGSPGLLRSNPRNMHQHVYGRGIDGNPFYSKQAWLASKAHAIMERLNGGGAHPMPGGGAGVRGTPGGPPLHGGHLPGPVPGGGPQPGGGGGQLTGWGGLQGVVHALSGTISQDQLNNMIAGYTGGNGHAVTGMHGALGGLSDYAVNWLANSGLLTQNAPANQVPTTDAQGNPLTGTALLLANIQNTLNSGAPKTYSLAQGVNANQLGALLQQAMGNIHQNVYANGFGAQPRPTLPVGPRV